MKVLSIFLLGVLATQVLCNDPSVYLFITDGKSTIYYQAITPTVPTASQVDFISPNASIVATNLSLPSHMSFSLSQFQLYFCEYGTSSIKAIDLTF